MLLPCLLLPLRSDKSRYSESSRQADYWNRWIVLLVTDTSLFHLSPPLLLISHQRWKSTLVGNTWGCSLAKSYGTRACEGYVMLFLSCCVNGRKAQRMVTKNKQTHWPQGSLMLSLKYAWASSVKFTSSADTPSLLLFSITPFQCLIHISVLSQATVLPRHNEKLNPWSEM